MTHVQISGVGLHVATCWGHIFAPLSRGFRATIATAIRRRGLASTPPRLRLRQGSRAFEGAGVRKGAPVPRPFGSEEAADHKFGGASQVIHEMMSPEHGGNPRLILGGAGGPVPSC